MMNLYEKIYSILKEHWEDDALEFFWTRDKTSSVEDVALTLFEDVEKGSAKAESAVGLLLWTYGNGIDDLNAAKQMVLSAYLKSSGLEKRRYRKELDQIEQDINKNEQ